MPRYYITVEGTAAIRETWIVTAKRRPTPAQVAGYFNTRQGHDARSLEYVKDEVTGDEERDYSTIEIGETVKRVRR